MRVKGYSDKLYNKKFYTATNTPITALSLSSPIKERDNFLNKPNNKGKMIWLTEETLSSPKSSKWLDWAIDGLPNRYKNYKYITEIEFNAGEILMLDSLDYYMNGLPEQYFCLATRGYDYWFTPEYLKNKEISDNKVEYAHLFELAKSMDAYTLALDYNKIADAYTGVYVSQELIDESYDALHSMPLSSFEYWGIETLVIWSNDAVKKITNHEFERLEAEDEQWGDDE